MAHVMKSTAGGCGSLLAHYERELKKDGTHRQYGNQEIDLSRTHLNYNLAPERDGGQLEFIKQRTSEVKCLKRDDVNVMCSWVITAPEGLATRIEHREKQRPLLYFEGKEAQSNLKLFFEESYKFLNDRYGHSTDKNVVSAYVHMDEKTPHMHYAFVPVVIDRKKGHEKVSAYEAINRNELKKFHPDLDKYMTKVFGRDIGLVNQATKDGNKTVEELKREAQIIQSEVREYRELKANIDELDKKPKAIKIPFTDKLIVLEKTADRSNTTEQAKGYIANRSEIQDIRVRASEVSQREKVADGREQKLDEREKTFAVKEKQLDREVKAVYAALHNKPEPSKHVNFGYSSANYIYSMRGELAEKEKQVEDMYNTQVDLNQLYEQKSMDFDNLWARHIGLEDELEEAQKTISHLEVQIDTLQANLSQVGIKHQNEIETLSSTLKTQNNTIKNDMATVIANMAMAIGSAKYHDEYKISHLSEPEGHFIDAISNYAEKWLKDFGHHELSEEVQTKVLVSKGIQKHIKELEPKRQINRGYDLSR